MVIKLISWIKGTWLYLLLILMIPLLISLGIWQLDRADQKEKLLAQMWINSEMTFDHVSDVPVPYSSIELTGLLQNKFYWWDNRTFKGRAGYELLTLVKVEGSGYEYVLVNLGFIADKSGRKTLPEIPKIPRVVFWRAQVRAIDLNWLETQILSGKPDWPDIAPVILELEPAQPFAFQANWHPVSMKPEKHLGYAVQWFAMAFMLILASFIFSRNKNNRGEHAR